MDVGLRYRILELAAAEGTVMVADETMAELDIDTPGQLPLPFPAYGEAWLARSVSEQVTITSG